MQKVIELEICCHSLHPTYGSIAHASMNKMNFQESIRNLVNEFYL